MVHSSSSAPTTPAPAAFLGHGNPMNALQHNRYSESWRRFGRACGTPTAILMISAHWYTNATAVTAMPRPRTIHDFYGFPRELFAFQYPAPGSAKLAAEVAELARPDHVGLDAESWGLDHGAWSVLAHAFPRADVPVVQLSINALKPFSYHMELAARLAPLRERGVVIIGSGNLVHNLGRIDWDSPEGGYPWAERFDQLARDHMLSSPGDVPALEADPDYRLIAPTPEHFIPLLYIASLAAHSARPAEVLVQGLAYGSISMTSYALDLPSEPAAAAPTAPAATHATPATVPADQTNM